MYRKSFIIILIAFVLLSSQGIYGAERLSNEEIEAIIEEVAIEKKIPPVILKAIAWKESGYTQFRAGGEPFVSRGNTGIMQVNRVHRYLNQERLQNDIRYNIEAGADILLGRWYASGTHYPRIGDMDPMVLEHWYFALWGYNGWVARNNPNVSGDKAYQEAIFQLIRDKFNQPVTSLDPTLLPASGLPSGKDIFPTPEIHHYVELESESIFSDLTGHPQRLYVEELYELGVVSGVGNDLFMPDAHLTKEQLAKLLTDAFELQADDSRPEELITDYYLAEAWARPYLSIAFQQGYLLPDEAGRLNPKELVTKQETLEILARGLDKETEFFTEHGIFTERDAADGKAYLTRGELCEWLYQILITR